MESLNADIVQVVEGTPVVCGAGLVSLDVLLSLDREGNVPVFVGGTCGNVLSILSYLGWSAFPIARLGSGAVATALIADLRQCGVREDFLVADERAETPIIVQENKRMPNGKVTHKFVWQCPSCGSYLPMFRPPLRAGASLILDRLPRQDVFFFDRVAPSTVALAEASAERGALVVFEPQNQKVKDKAYLRALNAASIVKYSAERIPKLTKPAGCQPLLEIQTLGGKGLRYRLRGDRRWTTLPSISSLNAVLDTSGAGDWTSAGILHLLGGQNRSCLAERCLVETAISFGQALAAINCSFEGARGAMYFLSPDELRQRASLLSAGQAPTMRLGRSQLKTGHTAQAHCASCWPAYP